MSKPEWEDTFWRNTLPSSHVIGEKWPALFSLWREKKNQGQSWCLVSNTLISLCLYGSQVVPSNWHTTLLRCHNQYFLSNPQYSNHWLSTHMSGHSPPQRIWFGFILSREGKEKRGPGGTQGLAVGNLSGWRPFRLLTLQAGGRALWSATEGQTCPDWRRVH